MTGLPPSELLELDMDVWEAIVDALPKKGRTLSGKRR